MLTTNHKKNLDDEEIIILKCFNELDVNCGRSLLSKILKGSKDQYIISEKLYENSQYGAIHKYPISKILNVIDELIQNGFFEIVKSDSYFRRPILKLTDQGLSRIENSETQPIEKSYHKVPVKKKYEITSNTSIHQSEYEDIKTKSSHESNSSLESDNTNKSNDGELIVSKETWHRIFHSFKNRDRKRRKDHRKDGGVN